MKEQRNSWQAHTMRLHSHSPFLKQAPDSHSLHPFGRDPREWGRGVYILPHPTPRLPRGNWTRGEVASSRQRFLLLDSDGNCQREVGLGDSPSSPSSTFGSVIKGPASL